MNNLYKILYKLLGWWRLKTKKNFGLIEEEIAGSPILGAFIPREILQPSGQWDLYLPEIEYQRFAWGDTMNCTKYSQYNTFETLLKRKYNETWDFSDRFGGKMAGNTHEGNSMSWTFQSDVNNGFLSWLMWREESLSWDDYYKPIPQKLKDLALENKKYLKYEMEWVRPSIEELKEALKYSPLWVAVYAYGKKVDGVYQRIEGYMPNHCVMIYGWDEDGNWKVYDHYLGNERRLLAPDYIIGYAANIFITKT